MNLPAVITPPAVPVTPEANGDLLRVVLAIEPDLARLYSRSELESRVRRQLWRLKISGHVTRFLD